MTVADLTSDFRLLDRHQYYDELPHTGYLYLLVRDGVVVYVGVCKGDLKMRGHAHRSGKKPKVFDSLYYAIIPLKEASDHEHAWIRWANPEYNVEGRSRKYRGYFGGRRKKGTE